ncbi:hypothetical protein O181_004399 [Austropuccinia psidii MF-1]|uniref:Reverse transcriptase domain-containing protein n=1 Tax=Austropuccinia psidii MF-1 TaxID=1389203 RepID=A0A9Q3BFS3_9BASI|nr:hypothetical protein [Austropuccinia psidii MF-1]
MEKLDIKIPNKPFINNGKPKETFKPNKPDTNEKRKCHKCGGIRHLANSFLKKAKINDIMNTEEDNDKEDEPDSEKDTEESETSEMDEINIINAKINNIDLIYEVVDVNSNLPQVRTSDTNLTNIQDAKLCRIKPAKGKGYTAGKSSVSIFMVENQEEEANLDTGEFFTCVGKGYLKTIIPYWEEKHIPIQGVKIIVHFGIYESLRMEFAIKNAPYHYQRMLNTIFPEELSEGWLIIYIYDIMVYSETLESHLTRLERVF